MCWSPKGKQLVVGKKDGKLMQFDQQLRPKKEIPGPPEFAPGSMSGKTRVYLNMLTTVLYSRGQVAMVTV